jgi:hypothetical protein
VVSYRASEKLSLYISLALIIIGLVGSVVTSGKLTATTTVLFYGFLELTLVGIFTLLFLSFIPGLFPSKVSADSIFYSGLGKEPYISNDQVYRPGIPASQAILLTLSILVFWVLQVPFVNLISYGEVPIYINVAYVLAFVLILFYWATEGGRSRKVTK